MPTYRWTALDPAGTTRKGSVDAVDARAVAEILERDGYAVVSVSKVKWPPTNFHLETIGRRDLIHFTYKFIPLVASSLTLDRSLDILRGEVRKHRIKNALINIKRDMHNGSAMSHAMARHPDIFNHPYVTAVRAGEESGNMPRSMSMMGSYLEWLDRIVRQVWAAIAYPIAVLVALCVLAGVLAFFVIPTFMNLYERLGFEFTMPLPTKILFGVTGFIRSYWLPGVIIIAVIAAVFILRHRFPKLRYFLQRLLLKTPIIGNMTRQLQALQFCRFFHLLHSSGVPTKRALAEAKEVMTNVPMQQEVGRISHRLDQGMSLGEAFSHSRDFPSLVAEQIRVGEESGNVDQSMEYVIRYYDAELDYSIRRFTGVLGPVLVLILAFVILFLALSFYLPLFEIATLIEPPTGPGLQ
jgi:type IV pilus assembly protein PilC